MFKLYESSFKQDVEKMKILKMFFLSSLGLKTTSGLYFMLLCVLFNTSAFNKPDCTGLKNENHFRIILILKKKKKK